MKITKSNLTKIIENELAKPDSWELRRRRMVNTATAKSCPLNVRMFIINRLQYEYGMDLDYSPADAGEPPRSD